MNPMRCLWLGAVLVCGTSLGCSEAPKKEPTPEEKADFLIKEIRKEMPPPAEGAKAMTEEEYRQETQKLMAKAEADGRRTGTTMRMIAEAAEYEIHVGVPESIASDVLSYMGVGIRPKGQEAGAALDQNVPATVIVTAPAAVAVARPQQQKDDAQYFDPFGAAWQFQITASAPGVHELKAALKFGVCTGKGCEQKTADVTWKVVVK